MLHGAVTSRLLPRIVFSSNAALLCSRSPLRKRFFSRSSNLKMPHSVHTTSGSTTPSVPEQSSLQVSQRFWNANLPESKWTEECPDFLLGQTQKNISILSGNEDEYHYLTWQESKELVDTNRIDNFQRSPFELRRYLQYMFKLEREYASVLNFVQQERLRWDSISPSAEPLFTNPLDYKILYNDWPYGIDCNITHLVIWTKFLLEDDPETGFLTTEHHELIEGFVQRTFCNKGGVNRGDLIWFRNWKSLKSVHALEHFHVMLYRAPPEFLKRITSGDKPTSEVVND